MCNFAQGSRNGPHPRTFWVVEASAAAHTCPKDRGENRQQRRSRNSDRSYEKPIFYVLQIIMIVKYLLIRKTNNIIIFILLCYDKST